MPQASDDETLPPSNSHVSDAIDRATAFEQAGNHDAAVAVLSEQIDAGNDTRLICLYCRGSAYLESGRYDRALSDFSIIMANRLRFVREALQPAAAANMAYVYAVRGEGAFASVIKRVPPEKNFFIRRELLTRADLEEMYRANSRDS